MNRIALVVTISAAVLFGGVCTGCTTNSRSQRLIALAVEETNQIKEPKVRLAGLLRNAVVQNDHGWYADSRVSLQNAQKTLESAGAAELDEFDRIAGWVSISELARAGDNRGIASHACEQAVKVLRSIEPSFKRCQYVRGVAEEVRQLRGKAAACSLLREAGPWAKAIDPQDERRGALVSFASALFAWDDFEGGKGMLRQDNDPAWRSKTLMVMAREEEWRARATKSLFAANGATAQKVGFLDPSVKYDMPVNYRATYARPEFVQQK